VQEKHGGDDSDEESSQNESESESEDENGVGMTPRLEAQIEAVRHAIRTGDPRLHDPTFQWYDNDDDGEEPAVDKKEKPLYLRDYHRERYMRGDVGAEEDGQEQEVPKTYGQEQDQHKQAFLAAMKAGAGQGSVEDGDGDDFFEPKETPRQKQDGVQPSKVPLLPLTADDVANAHKDPEAYLERYIATRAWIAPEGAAPPQFDPDQEDDDDELDLADQFENDYNLRYEDPSKSNEVLKSYSRTLVESRSVRREKKTRRKRGRERENEEKEAEKREREEERARLKKLKVKETHERSRKIKQAARVCNVELKGDELVKILDNSWENDQWEEEMVKNFDAQYFAEVEQFDGSDQNGAGPSTSKKKAKKPQWDDDIDVNDIVPDFESKDARPATVPSDSEADEDETDTPAAKKRKTDKDRKKQRADAKSTAHAEDAEIEALATTRLELDDLASSFSAADGPAAPFRYRQTSPTSFGLTAADILMAPSDAVLNEFASLKTLAPFRDAQKKAKDKKRLGKKARLRQWRRETFGREFEQTGPQFEFGAQKQAPDGGEAPGDVEGPRPGKKRKRSKGKGKGAAS